MKILFPQSLLVAAVLVVTAVLANKFETSLRAGWRFTVISIFLLVAVAFAPAPLTHFQLLAITVSGLVYGSFVKNRETVVLYAGRLAGSFQRLNSG